MPSSSLLKAPSRQAVLSSPVPGNVRVVCPRTSSKTRPHTPRKRKIHEISTTPPLEKIAMTASSPSPLCASSSKSPPPTLPPLEISQYRPQFASTPCDGLPSPAATEIVDVESEDFTRTARQHGVKVRDFAYEPKSTTFDPTPLREYWDPLVALLRHDTHIRRPFGSLGTYRITGKDLWRLLDSGWVEAKEAKRNWKEEDWNKMKEYRDQFGGPYPYVIGNSRRKPVADLRKKLRRAAYPCLPFDIPDENIYIPQDRPGMWTGEGMQDCQDDDDDESGVVGKRRKIADAKAKEPDFPPPMHESSSTFNPAHSAGSSSTLATSTQLLGHSSSRSLASSRPKRNLKRTQTLVRVQ